MKITVRKNDKKTHDVQKKDVNEIFFSRKRKKQSYKRVLFL